MDFRHCRNAALCLFAAGLAVFSGCAKQGNTASGASSGVSSAQSAVPSSTASAVSTASASSTAASAASSGGAPSSGGVSSQTAPIQAAPVNAVAESAKADFSYLDDAVFIGDSVSLKLKNYVTAMRKTQPGFFGKAQFLAAGSMGSANALKPLNADSIHPAYNGKKMLLEDSVAAMGAKRVYIMLGTNDIALYGIDGSVRNMDKLLANIKVKSPDAMILVQSSTPMIKEKQMKQLNNANLIAYDNALSKMCSGNGYYFVDVASALRDKDGNLPREYCSDPDNLGIHFTDKACEIWINYLLTHTVRQ